MTEKKLKRIKSAFDEANKLVIKAKRKNNTPIADSILSQLREHKGSGYNSQLEYELVLNGYYLLPLRSLWMSRVDQVFVVRLSEDDDTEFNTTSFTSTSAKLSNVYRIEVAEERVLRN